MGREWKMVLEAANGGQEVEAGVFRCGADQLTGYLESCGSISGRR
jgi:hypothetical protein